MVRNPRAVSILSLTVRVGYRILCKKICFFHDLVLRAKLYQFRPPTDSLWNNMIVFDDLLFIPYWEDNVMIFFIPYWEDNVMTHLSQREQLVGRWSETGRCYVKISVV